ncbi:hypothetical protein MEX01_38810 [Methylorubrum extorquens]|nr:hypothetical protein MEX01_38810 [Methylorubrum extorquens]
MEWKGRRVLSIPSGVFPDRNTNGRHRVNQRDGSLFERGLRAATPRAEALPTRDLEAGRNSSLGEDAARRASRRLSHHVGKKGFQGIGTGGSYGSEEGMNRSPAGEEVFLRRNIGIFRDT